MKRFNSDLCCDKLNLGVNTVGRNTLGPQIQAGFTKPNIGIVEYKSIKSICNFKGSSCIIINWSLMAKLLGRSNCNEMYPYIFFLFWVTVCLSSSFPPSFAKKCVWGEFNIWVMDILKTFLTEKIILEPLLFS